MKGVQKASALADISDIPRPHVYSVIKLLQEKGLIITIPEKVAKYQAVPLDTVLSKLMEDRMASIKALETIGKDLAGMIKDKGVTPKAEEAEKVRLYTGRWAIIDLIHKMMEHAANSCLIITNDRSFVMTSAAYEQDFASMDRRNIRVQLLLPIEKDTVTMVERLAKKAHVHHLDSMDQMDVSILGDVENAFLRVVVIDETEVLFVKSSPGSADESAIWTGQRELAKMISLMFNHMWRNAPDMDSKKAEIETGRKPEHLTPIYGDVEVYKAIRMIISKTRSDVCCAISQEQLIYNLSTLTSEFRVISAKGVKIHLLVSIKGGEMDRGRLLASPYSDISAAVETLKSCGADIRHPVEESILRIVMNDDEVIFNLLGESTISSKGENIGVYTNHQDTLARIREHFNQLWDNSVDVEEKIAEINKLISKEVMKDGEEGIKRYFDRLSDMNLGNFAIKSSDHENKTITIVCTDPEEERKKLITDAKSDVCESVQGAFKSLGEYVHQGTKMVCKEVRCVSRGDKQCEFKVIPDEKDKKMVAKELVRFFDSLKTDRVRAGNK